MIIPNLYLLAKVSGVTSIIGSPPRFYSFGQAPQGVVAPYATQQAITIAPSNDLSGPARADYTRVQVSCWSDNTGTGPASVKALAEAMRAAIEPTHHLLNVRDMGRDQETMRYRIDLDFEIWNHRD